MTVCTFFAHRDCPDSLEPELRSAVETLITEQGVDLFYVGNQGQFDALVRRVLAELTCQYPHVRYAVVLAYLPGKDMAQDDTMFPEGIEEIHPRYAISWRNDWILRQADFVITYITHSWGGAARYAEKAQRQGKQIIPLHHA